MRPSIGWSLFQQHLTARPNKRRSRAKAPIHTPTGDQAVSTNVHHEDSSPGTKTRFDATFATALAPREEQIQQNRHPVIRIHRSFAQRRGVVVPNKNIGDTVWFDHALHGMNTCRRSRGGDYPDRSFRRFARYATRIGTPSKSKAPRSWFFTYLW